MDLSGLKFLVVGAGLFGSVIADRIARDLDERVLVVEKRDHLGGNCFSLDDEKTGIHYHAYGTHVFHTSNESVWEYINRFTTFNGYIHQVFTTYRDRVYRLPINLETINAFYQVNLRPFEVESFLAGEIAKDAIEEPGNFEESVISLIGRPLYEALIKGYTKKKLKKDPAELPSSLLEPPLFSTHYAASYYSGRWQGVPVDGYTALFERMLNHKNIEFMLNTDYFDIKEMIPSSTTVIYSGPIDRFFAYTFGRLEWRTVSFERRVVAVKDFQGTAVMNFADEHMPYTRIHEPRHLHPERHYTNERTIILKEYAKTDDNSDPYFPAEDHANRNLLRRYQQEAATVQQVVFGGRLAHHQNLHMGEVIENALQVYEERIKKTFTG